MKTSSPIPQVPVTRWKGQDIRESVWADCWCDDDDEDDDDNDDDHDDHNQCIREKGGRHHHAAPPNSL